MSWFKGAHPTPAEMRRELALYLSVAHPAKKHVSHTGELLRKLWLVSHKRPCSDVWGDLHSLRVVTGNGTITGGQIKSAFRQRLLKLQHGRCCYCQRWLTGNAYAKPIEHILPRIEYPQFSVEFWNLAVACSDCNGLKADEVWIEISTARRRYPRASEFATAFHPRFHRYEEHVRYVRLERNLSAVVMFVGLTTQGKHLCGKLLHRTAGKETLVRNNPVLASAMDQIRKFEGRDDASRFAGIDAFCKALDRSLVRLFDAPQ